MSYFNFGEEYNGYGSSRSWYHLNSYNVLECTQFYNTNHFNAFPERLTNDEFSVSPTDSWPAWTQDPKQQDDVLTDPKNRRIIKRSFLYSDDEEKNTTNDDSADNDHNIKYSSGYDWTQQNWHKACNIHLLTSSTLQKVNLKKSKLPKGVTKALAQPVKLGKAESMMQKMGWQGGALGRSGDGIIEPIAPNTSYSERVGFGQQVVIKKQERPNAKKKPKKEKKPKEKLNKELFKTNVLLLILDFVRNDFEVEVLFDPQLRNWERKLIHRLVGKVNGEDDEIGFNNDDQFEIVNEINNCNVYVLGTESKGKNPMRQLYLYKEGPNNVFLITPDDLRDEDIEDPTVTEEKDHGEENIEHTEEMSIIEEEETNPFLKSITKDFRNETFLVDEEKVTQKLEERCKVSLYKDDIMEKFKEFLVEFLQNEEYTELWFLGPFDDGEIDAIRHFVNHHMSILKNCEDSERLLGILRDRGYTLQRKENFNGNSIIFKCFDYSNTTLEDKIR